VEKFIGRLRERYGETATSTGRERDELLFLSRYSSPAEGIPCSF